MEKAVPAAAGIRTFTVAAFAGAVGQLVGGPLLTAVIVAAVGAFVALGYWRTRGEDDPGLTTEIALVVTALLGALAIVDPALAGGGGVAVAVVLAGRTQLHHFVGEVLTEREVRGALVLAAATLIVLPLLPDRPMGPFGAVNPRSVWLLVILLLAIGAAGHVAVRALGIRFGLPAAGLASGFVSSTATIGAMGARARKTPELMPAAVAGAVLSTVATVVQMALVVAAVSLPTLQALALPLALAGLAAVAYGIVFTLAGLRRTPDGALDAGEAFSLGTALVFGATLTAIMLAAAALQAWFGGLGVAAAAGLAGLVDAHAAAISVAALARGGQLAPADAVLPILAGFSTNAASKIVLASTAGGRAYALRVAPGVVLVTAAAWAGALLSHAA